MPQIQISRIRKRSSNLPKLLTVPIKLTTVDQTDQSRPARATKAKSLILPARAGNRFLLMKNEIFWKKFFQKFWKKFFEICIFEKTEWSKQIEQFWSIYRSNRRKTTDTKVAEKSAAPKAHDKGRTLQFAESVGQPDFEPCSVGPQPFIYKYIYNKERRKIGMGGGKIKN